MNPPAIELAQVCLQVQAPYLRIVGQFIAVQGQALHDGFQHIFCDERPREGPLGLDGRGLLAGHSGGK